MDTRITHFLGHVDIFTRRIPSLETDRWEKPESLRGLDRQGRPRHPSVTSSAGVVGKLGSRPTDARVIGVKIGTTTRGR